MSNTAFVLPGHFKLLAAVLSSHDGSNVNDISSLIHFIELEEGLEFDSIRGHIRVLDNVNLLDTFPIRGEEKLELTVVDALEQKRTYELAVYKVTDVEVKDTNDGLRYKLHVTSKARFDAGTRRVLRSFEASISTIAEVVFATYYGETSKELLIEDTEGMFRCVVPNYTPMQTMNFLANRAFSTKSPSCSFRFFETADFFYFVSDEYLVTRALDNPEIIKEFTYSDALDKSGENFYAQMQNIISLENNERVNSITDLHSGAYKNNVIELDLVRKTVSNRRYSYDDQTYAKGESVSPHSATFVQDTFTDENERRFLLFKDYSSVGDMPGQLRAEQYLPEITSNRLAYRHHLNNTVTFVTINGRLDVCAGDMVKLVIPDFTSNDKKKENAVLSGLSMVDTCVHRFNLDVHSTHLKLLKYDWNS